MSTEAPQFENIDAAQVHKQEEREREEEREEAFRQNETLQAITKKRSEKTIHVDVEGEELPFHVPGGEVDRIQDMVGEFAGMDEEEMSREQYERYQEMRGDVDAILGEKCKIDGATAEWWSATFAPAERQEILGQFAEGGLEAEDAEEFR